MANDWHAFVRFFRERMPVRRRVVVRRVAGMTSHGSTSINDAETVITVSINASDPPETQRETLVHEWGHVAEYDRWGNHSDRWGKFHALAYQAGVEWEAS